MTLHEPSDWAAQAADAWPDISAAIKRGKKKAACRAGGLAAAPKTLARLRARAKTPEGRAILAKGRATAHANARRHKAEREARIEASRASLRADIKAATTEHEAIRRLLERCR